MTDEQIIKALECCINGNCDGCYNVLYNCMRNAITNALDLINRKNAEIERLREYYKMYFDRKAEIEEKQLEIDYMKDRCSLTEEYIKKLKSEAIKEFAERLCKGRVENDPIVIAVKAELDYVIGVGLDEEDK